MYGKAVVSLFSVLGLPFLCAPLWAYTKIIPPLSMYKLLFSVLVKITLFFHENGHLSKYVRNNCVNETLFRLKCDIVIACFIPLANSDGSPSI